MTNPLFILGTIFSSVYVWTPVIGWFIAQLIKIIISSIREKKVSIGLIMASGGMPSSHTSTIMALATCIGVLHGWDSPMFAIAFIMAFIVMYDAAGVRRETGKQAQILNKLTSDLSKGSTKYLDRDLKELVGHTPLQVVAGAVLGILVGYIVPFLWQFG